MQGCFAQSTFIIAIAITVALDETALIIAIVIRAMLCITRCTLALCPICAAFVLMCPNLFAELVLQFEVSVLFNTLELHEFEHTINLVLFELRLKELGDAFEHLCLELLTGIDKLIMVVLVKRHVIIEAQVHPKGLACCRPEGLWRYAASP
jgi:hypothetical protein